MRKLTLAMIILCSIIALLIIALIVFSITVGSGSRNVLGSLGDGNTAFSGERELLVDQTVSAQGITELSVSLSSETVDFYPSEDGQFRVVQYGVNLDADRIIRVVHSGSSLEIERPRHTSSFFSFGIGYSQSWVEIYVPTDYRNDMLVKLTSGDLRFREDLDLRELYIELTSGNIRTDRTLRAAEAEIKMTSGDLKIAALEAPRFHIGATSGRAQFDTITGSGSVRMTAGDIRLGDVYIADDLDISITSGNITANLPDDPSLQYTGRATSGNLNTYFATYSSNNNSRNQFATVGDAPYKTLSISITAGNCRITGETAKDSTAGAGDFSHEPDGDDWEDRLENWADELENALDEALDF